MAVLKVYNGSTWDTAVGKTYNGATWEEKMQFYNGTAFVELYPTLEISPLASGVTNSSINTDCIAGIQYSLSGAETASNNAGGYSVSRGDWLDVGLNSEVWIQRVINTGTLTVDAGSGRLVLSTTRTFSYTQVGVGIGGPNITFNFYDAASGGNLLDSVTFVLSAEHVFDI